MKKPPGENKQARPSTKQRDSRVPPSGRTPLSHTLLEKHLRELKCPFIPEFRFHIDRKWRFDYLLPDSNVAIEVEGSVWTQGRHTRGKGFLADMLKYRTAAMMGYRVCRFSTQEVLNGEAKKFLQEWLER